MLRFNILTAVTSIGLALSAPALALTGTDGPAHGMAMHGDTKYGPAFTHFDYVNPGAPKGGRGYPTDGRHF